MARLSHKGRMSWLVAQQKAATDRYLTVTDPAKVPHFLRLVALRGEPCTSATEKKGLGRGGSSLVDFSKTVLGETLEHAEPLVACAQCSRYFSESRIQQHHKACAKRDRSRKPKPSAQAKRLEAIEKMNQVDLKALSSQKRAPSKAKLRDWRKEHDAFQSALHPAAAVDMIACCDCDRKFPSASACAKHKDICPKRKRIAAA